MHAAESAELRDEQIALRIECDAVRRQHETLTPLRRRNLVGAGSLFRVGTDARHDRACLVEHGHAAVQFADDRVVPVDRDGSRQQQILRDDAQEGPIEREMYDAIVGAIAGDDAGRLKPRVDRQLVQRVEAVGRLLAAERGDVLAGLVEPVDVVAGVPVGDIEVAVGRDVQCP